MRAASRKMLARNELQLLSFLEDEELVEDILKIFAEVNPQASDTMMLAAVRL